MNQQESILDFDRIVIRICPQHRRNKSIEKSQNIVNMSQSTPVGRLKNF